MQENQFERPGCGKPIQVDVRLIATTQRDLAGCVAQGTFRSDLFFRLNVFPLKVPPLRERIADIPQLAAHWFERFARRHGLKLGGISEEALRHLMAYSWPGNVRELENVLERAVILAGFGQRIEAGAFDFLQTRTLNDSQGVPTFQRPAWGSPNLPQSEPLMTLDELEKQHVFRALEYTNQNRTRAADLLKISVRTLRNKLHLYRAEGFGPGCRKNGLAIAPQEPGQGQMGRNRKESTAAGGFGIRG